jgi:hypothetical protein
MMSGIATSQSRIGMFRLPLSDHRALDALLDIVLRVTLLYLIVLLSLTMTTRKIKRTSTPLDRVVIFSSGASRRTLRSPATDP